MPFNRVQKKICESFWEDWVRQLRARTKTHSSDALTALECCLTLTEICQKEENLERLGILESILLLRGIMIHSCPQNRHPDEHDETLPKSPGLVSWRGLDGEIESEPEGILTLTPYNGWEKEESRVRRRRLEGRDDDVKDEVTSEDVKLFFREKISSEFSRLSEITVPPEQRALPSSSSDADNELFGSDQTIESEEESDEKVRRQHRTQRSWWNDGNEWPTEVVGAILMAFIAILIIAFASKRK
eukprot:TRINITY_DN1533_c3_g2_i1.p1 TRINITY_DN1533_c3_g2~~TRINITY_DN1533_c3_g2_i1.p1  ORF type:complete len:244 (+),score=61.84 TRINITY_DN1533_c3_g2_i1:87-818(+)